MHFLSATSALSLFMRRFKTHFDSYALLHSMGNDSSVRHARSLVAMGVITRDVSVRAGVCLLCNPSNHTGHQIRALMSPDSREGIIYSV